MKQRYGLDVLIFAVTLFAVLTFANIVYANSVNGEVINCNGKVVRGATVTISQIKIVNGAKTKEPLSTKTDKGGFFNFNGLGGGTFVVEVYCPPGKATLSSGEFYLSPAYNDSAYFKFICCPPGGSVFTRDAGTENDLREITINMGDSTLTAYLPNDMRNGDTISGTVYLTPNNQSEISGNVRDLEINGSRQTAWTPETGTNRLKATLKFALAAGSVPMIILKSKGGKKVTSFPLAVNAASTHNPTNNIQLPTIGQQGKPLSILGPFDGNAENTICSIGGQSVTILAESPRQAIFEAPKTFTGLAEIKIEDKLIKPAKGTFRNIGIDWFAPKTDFLKGEQGTATLTVDIGKNLKEPIQVEIECSGAVNLHGGNYQIIEIQPNKVNSDGVFKQTFQLKATEAGRFNLKAIFFSVSLPIIYVEDQDFNFCQNTQIFLGDLVGAPINEILSVIIRPPGLATYTLNSNTNELKIHCLKKGQQGTVIIEFVPQWSGTGMKQKRIVSFRLNCI